MSAHSVDNSQCDLNMYGPDPGDGSVKCTCDEDAPVEPSTAPRKGPEPVPRISPSSTMPRHTGPQGWAQIVETDGCPPGSIVTLTGRAAATHAELRDAARELRAAQDLYRKAEARWKAALDAHMQEIQ